MSSAPEYPEISYSIVLTSRGEKVLVDNDVAAFLVNKSVFLSAGYPSFRVSGERSSRYLHRVVMDAPRGLDIDHINRNKMDCRRANLRVATRKQNLRNSGPKGGNKYKGVSSAPRLANHKKKWTAKIRVDSKTVHLGYFVDEDSAARAYNEAAKQFHGEFAWLNPIV